MLREGPHRAMTSGRPWAASRLARSANSGQATQGMALRAQGFGTADHAEALAIRGGKGRFHHTGTDIAETVDGESKLFHMHSFGKKPGAASWPLARHS